MNDNEGISIAFDGDEGIFSIIEPCSCIIDVEDGRRPDLQLVRRGMSAGRLCMYIHACR